MHPLCRPAMLAFAVFAVFVVPLAAPPVVAATSPSPPAGDVSPPAPTPPPNQRVTYAYKTFLGPAAVDYFGIDNFNVVFGTMTLTFNPEGTIEGRYEPDNDTAQSVTGNIARDGTLTLQIGNQRYTGHFTRRGFAVSTSTVPGMGFRLWGQFVHA
ncbi:MAG: hypothetical protein JWN27_472 [Candidatus Eremiobacteraeota bacterium]|jgi:hypothetical protein|nr:hypothetical protein [Candidatus Eremiobacteraeota bacterium]